jgi:hypothetical protein
MHELHRMKRHLFIYTNMCEDSKHVGKHNLFRNWNLVNTSEVSEVCIYNVCQIDAYTFAIAKGATIRSRLLNDFEWRESTVNE